MPNSRKRKRKINFNLKKQLQHSFLVYQKRWDKAWELIQPSLRKVWRLALFVLVILNLLNTAGLYSPGNLSRESPQLAVLAFNRQLERGRATSAEPLIEREITFMKIEPIKLPEAEVLSVERLANAKIKTGRKLTRENVEATLAWAKSNLKWATDATLFYLKEGGKDSGTYFVEDRPLALVREIKEKADSVDPTLERRTLNTAVVSLASLFNPSFPSTSF